MRFGSKTGKPSVVFREITPEEKALEEFRRCQEAVRADDGFCE